MKCFIHTYDTYLFTYGHIYVVNPAFVITTGTQMTGKISFRVKWSFQFSVIPQKRRSRFVTINEIQGRIAECSRDSCGFGCESLTPAVGPGWHDSPKIPATKRYAVASERAGLALSQWLPHRYLRNKKFRDDYSNPSPSTYLPPTIVSRMTTNILIFPSKQQKSCPTPRVPLPRQSGGQMM